MIQHIRTIGFKGFDLDEDVPEKVIYTGRNKSGKSSRAGAISLALYGYIPFSTAGKRPSDILDSFGKDVLAAAVTIDGSEFARKFSRNPKGGVSQSLQIDKKKVSPENFAVMLSHSHKEGSPRIVDVAEFMKQSDAKKTDTLFELFPNDDLSGIDTEIENAKKDVSRIAKKKEGAESTVVRLNHSKHNYEIPSGNIAETQNEIKSVESKIEDLEKQIKEAEIEEEGTRAKAEGERLAKKESKDKAGIARHEILKGIGVDLDVSTCREMEESVWTEFFEKKNDEYQTEQKKIWIEELKDERDDQKKIDDHNKDLPPLQSSELLPDNSQNLKEAERPVVRAPGSDLDLERSRASTSIKLIIDALIGSGCGTCAALIVAKQELKKFKEVPNG